MSTPHVNKSTPCARCDHNYRNHCEAGRTHWDAEDYTYCCITQHCECGPCQCPGFVNPFNGAVTPWRRPTLPETPCAKCDHPKKHHCTKGRTSIEVDGVPYGCSHYMQWMQLHVSTAEVQPRCDSTACAEVVDVERRIFCPCNRFVSPYLRRRQKKRVDPMTLFPPEDLERAHDRYLQEQEQARPKTKAEILCEIATEDPTCTVTELAEAAERSKSWVRKHLRAAGITLAKPVRQTGRKP